MHATQVEHGRPLLSPIVVTGSTGPVGMALLGRLASFPSEIRPVTPDESLPAACRDAAAVIHLDDGVRSSDGHTWDQAILDAAQGVVDALAGSAVERIVFLSDVAAIEMRRATTSARKRRRKRCSIGPAGTWSSSAAPTSSAPATTRERSSARSLPTIAIRSWSRGPEPSASRRSFATMWWTLL